MVKVNATLSPHRLNTRVADYFFESVESDVVGESVPLRSGVLGRPVMANEVSKEVKNT